MRKTTIVTLVALLVCVITAGQLNAPLPAAHAAPSAGAADAATSPRTNSYAYHSGFAFNVGGSLTLAAGEREKLLLLQQDGVVIWKSSNADVATVDSTGTVCAKRAGFARITAENAAAMRTVACTVKVYVKRTQKQVRKALIKLKKQYRPGRRWTNSNYYYWQAANCHCYGCAAFVGIVSDRAFGKFAPFKRHARFCDIRAGDHVRIGGKHSVVVLRKRKKGIVVAEANYHRAIKWGRVISYSKLKRQGFYVETRYG